MPRAFLITHKRYNPQEVQSGRETSPELRVNTAEAEGATSSCLPNSNARKGPVRRDPPILEDDKNLAINKKLEKIFKGCNRGDGDESRYRQSYNTVDNSSDEFYNLTKLAEVSLAAAAGQLLWSNYRHGVSGGYFEKWPEQEFPEDLSQDSVSKSSEQKSTEVHTCPECGKRYSTSSNLARHRQTHRSLADKKARACPHCDKIYVSMPAYSMHVRTHNQGCKCTYCGKCFSRPWLLQGHIRTHTGEKPFKCTVCDKAFADKSNLRAHVQTHSNMKPHICGRCGKAFALKSYLYKHEESSCMKTQLPNERRQQQQQQQQSVNGTGNGDGSVRQSDVFSKPVLSIPTPVISIAIRV